MPALLTRRLFQRVLIAIALGGLVLGLVAWSRGRGDLAQWAWAAGTVPVVLALLVSRLSGWCGDSGCSSSCSLLARAMASCDRGADGTDGPGGMRLQGRNRLDGVETVSPR